MMSKLSQATDEAIAQGTYDAFLHVLDATGHYPITRDDILNSIKEGVNQAVSQYLDEHGLPGGRAS